MFIGRGGEAKEQKAIWEWGHERGRQTGKQEEQEQEERHRPDGQFPGCACHTADGESHLAAGDDVTE